ncbi:MAG TPA: dUTP diphosphatase [Pseudorhodoplanes sp.]|nr:dUTP diphosphatase [Pseudorhodoplanes sp.]
MSEVEVRRLPHGADLPLPSYQSHGASGLDLHAAVSQDIVIAAGGTAMVPTGIAVAIPEGLEGQVRPRSGLAARHAVTVLNSPGTIDADYRGEISVLLINHGRESFTVTRGMRIAQLVIAPVVYAQLRTVDRLSETARGTGGFGSTGTDANKFGAKR